MLFHTCLPQVQIGLVWFLSIFYVITGSLASPLNSNTKTSLVNPKNLQTRMAEMDANRKLDSKVSCFKYHDETGQLIVKNCLTENSGMETMLLVGICLGAFLLLVKFSSV